MANTMNPEPEVPADHEALAGHNRRQFLGRLGSMTAAAVAVGKVLDGTIVEAAAVGPQSSHQRRTQALRIRVEAAVKESLIRPVSHPTNRDDEQYPTIASFGKGLPHNALGEFDADAYRALVHAMKSGDPGDFESIPLGGTMKLVNPQSAFTFDLNCADSHRLGVRAAPAFSSAWRAAEAKEIYWQAVTRDVRFENYATDALTLAAAADLSASSDFRGRRWAVP